MPAALARISGSSTDQFLMGTKLEVREAVRKALWDEGSWLGCKFLFRLILESSPFFLSKENSSFFAF